VRQSPAGSNVNKEGAGNGEDTAHCDDPVRAVLNCNVSELATALMLLAVTTCKSFNKSY
jgi:hypothetical protein